MAKLRFRNKKKQNTRRRHRLRHRGGVGEEAEDALLFTKKNTNPKDKSTCKQYKNNVEERIQNIVAVQGLDNLKSNINESNACNISTENDDVTKVMCPQTCADLRTKLNGRKTNIQEELTRKKEEKLTQAALYAEDAEESMNASISNIQKKIKEEQSNIDTDVTTINKLYEKHKQNYPGDDIQSLFPKQELFNSIVYIVKELPSVLNVNDKIKDILTKEIEKCKINDKKSWLKLI